jgi:uncharacterized protein
MKGYQFWIKHLNLQPHPEGGFFRETYRSNLVIDHNILPVDYSGNRKLSTSIYYMLRSGEISRLHRLHSDELWYYHLGSSIKIVMIDQEGNKHTKLLGANLEKAEQLQVLIPSGTIFGAELIDSDSFSLLGCMVTPGFEFDDFEIFDKEDLLQAYPKHVDLINKFSK